MQRTLAVLGVALLVAWTYRELPAAGSYQAAAPRTAAISGIVSDAVTGRPIAGASVSVRASQAGVQDTPFPSPVLTDARGRFVFLDLPTPRRYSLFASRPGYQGGEYEGGVPIALADGQWISDANVRLQRPASVGGRVVDEREEAMVGVAVQVFSRHLVAGYEQLVGGPVATTDDRGVYRIPYLPAGRYVVAVLSVQATAPDAIADGPRGLPIGGLEGRGSSSPSAPRPEVRGASIDVDGRHRLVLTNFATPPPPGADRPRAYPPVFYPSARTVSEALAVDLGAGTARPDIDFQLAPVAAVRVSGHVTGAVERAANMVLRLMAPGTEALGFGAEVATTMVEPDGGFTFLNVPAGAYTLVASPTVTEVSSGSSSQGRLPKDVGYGPAQGLSMIYPAAPSVAYLWWESEAGASVWGQMSVSVGTADVSGLALTLYPAASVRGRVVFDDPVPPNPGERWLVALEPANGDPTLGAPHAYTVANDASHAFAIGGVRGGRYLVRTTIFAGWWVESVTVNGADVTDTGIDGASGRDYDDVIVTFTKAGARLSGVVIDARGQPAPGTVILFPVDRRRWVDYGLTPSRIRSTEAASDGAYEFKALPGGDYYIVAVPPDQSDAWVAPAFFAAAAAQAARVSLTVGAATRQDLRESEVPVR
jgi:Carboxypeptidase regulatory-like domain